MNVKQYLQSKYGVLVPATMTKAEARIFGIPYPLRHGWLSAYGSREISESDEARLRQSLTAKKARTYVVRGLDVLNGRDLPITANTSVERSQQRRAAQSGGPFITEQTRFDKPRCDCKTPPWEDCEHTAPKLDEDQAEHLRSILAS